MPLPKERAIVLCVSGGKSGMSEWNAGRRCCLLAAAQRGEKSQTPPELVFQDLFDFCLSLIFVSIPQPKSSDDKKKTKLYPMLWTVTPSTKAKKNRCRLKVSR